MTAPPPPPGAPGTRLWASWQLQHVFSPDDALAIRSLADARTFTMWAKRPAYAQLCHERLWTGWQARLAWAVLTALETDGKDPDDDIPF